MNPREAWEMMREQANSWLVDVRTPCEWQYAGSPELGGVGGRVIKLSWHIWPEMKINQEFIAQLETNTLPPDAHLLFLCRSGGRSLAAAEAVSAAGRQYIYNILGGFEGELDNAGQRGRRSGWKAEGLPWRQT